MDIYNTPNWYASLIKPSFAPPSSLFGPVWSVLYILIAIGFFYAIKLRKSNQLSPLVIKVFIINLLSNFLFSPIQFGLQNNLLAMIDIFVVWVTLAYLLKIFWSQQKLLFWSQLPYFLWVSFASILQISITYLNW